MFCAAAQGLLFGSDSRYLESANELDLLPSAGRLQQQQQQHKLLNIIELLLSRRTSDDYSDDDDDDYEWSSDAAVAVPEQLAARWRHVVVDDTDDINKRSWLRKHSALKRGPGTCINSCLTGGMSFVRCKSMCHW